MSLSVELLDMKEARGVDRYVMTHPDGSPFHETRWLQLVRATFGFETQTLVARDGGEIVGVLPLAMVNAHITGRRLVSVPFGVYGGILSSHIDAVTVLDEAACSLARTSGAKFIETRYIGRGCTTHTSVASHETYRRELPEDSEAVLGLIPRKARAEVRKARDRNKVVFVEGAHVFHDFLALYVDNKRRLGSPLFHRAYFQCLLDLYGPRATLHGISYQGRLVCAVLSLIAGDAIYPYYSGAAPGADRLGANNAMYASLMEEAVRRGLRLFDFGRSRLGSGPASFKRHMGFEPTPLDYQFYFPRGGRPPTLSPSNPRTALPRRILSGMPLWLARAVGPTMMRQVP